MKKSRFTLILLLTLTWIFGSLTLGTGIVNAQDKGNAGKDDQLTVIRGKIAYDKARTESWDGNQLIIPFTEIPTKLRAEVITPMAPYPAGHEKWTGQQYFEWEKKFIETEQGKKFLADQEKMLEEAPAFDVKYEAEGDFVIYDVPPGTYGIQGMVNKEIGGTNYRFEVFGKIIVTPGVDEIPLQPIRVEVTPLMAPKQKAPPIRVQTHDDKTTLSLDEETFKDQYVFVNFWISESPTAPKEQQLVQDMYEALKDKFPIKLLSISVDEDRKQALEFIVQHKLEGGSHGFTGSLDHRTLFDYGVRSYPSFWLIDQDGTIKMTQYEIGQAMRVKPDMQTIVSDRIQGKDAPTPAPENKDGDAAASTGNTDK